MELIFHERQEGSLCAQHCLNALLQGSYFTAVDLGSISEELDEQERERMAEGGVTTDEYRRFLDQPSSNMDDSGFFSVQVISKALEIWGLEMIPYGSAEPLAVNARSSPVQQAAFVCNFREHWFSVRKIATQWFNLNSMLTGPELISETYLSLFLTQLQQDGYSIFIVIGSLPGCEADSILRLVPAVQTSPPRLLRQQSAKKKTQNTDSTMELDLAMLRAMEASRNEVDDEDSSLQRAMELSLLSAQSQSQPRGATDVDSTCTKDAPSDGEEESLKRALELSLEAASSVGATSRPITTSSSTSTSSVPTSGSSLSDGGGRHPSSSLQGRTSDTNLNSNHNVEKSLSVEDVRKRRLEFLEKKQQPQQQLGSRSLQTSNGTNGGGSGVDDDDGIDGCTDGVGATKDVAVNSEEDQMTEEEELARALKMSRGNE